MGRSVKDEKSTYMHAGWNESRKQDDAWGSTDRMSDGS